MDMQIETPRLVLRPWHEDDVEQLVAGLNDLELAKWLAFVPHPYTISDAGNWIKHCRELAGAGTRPSAYEFAVERKSDALLIGGVSLNKINREVGTGVAASGSPSPVRDMAMGAKHLLPRSGLLS